MKKIRLGVNVDHVATLRQQRRGKEPDPVLFAREAIRCGADSIVCHLREDRRHIQEADVQRLRKAVKHLNLEMGLAPDIVQIALAVRPDQVTLVPEKRQELTTEGGLDVLCRFGEIRAATAKFREAGILVSLFIDPDPRQIRAAKEVRAEMIELHTGEYANHPNATEVKRLATALRIGEQEGLRLAVGHGLDYRNVSRIARLSLVEEANIGYSIVVRSLTVGWSRAVKEMKTLLRRQ